MVEKLEKIAKSSSKEKTFAEKMRDLKDEHVVSYYVIPAAATVLSFVGLAVVAALPGTFQKVEYRDVNNDGVKDKIVDNRVYLGHEHYEGVFRELYYSKEPRNLDNF